MHSLIIIRKYCDMYFDVNLKIYFEIVIYDVSFVMDSIYFDKSCKLRNLNFSSPYPSRIRLFSSLPFPTRRKLSRNHLCFGLFYTQLWICMRLEASELLSNQSITPQVKNKSFGRAPNNFLLDLTRYSDIQGLDTCYPTKK